MARWRVIGWAAAVAWIVALGGPLSAGETKAEPPAPEKRAPEKAGTAKEKQPPKPGEPLHVWADRIHYLQGENIARITGNATIIKGDMRIDADAVVADLDEKTSEFRKMTATGHVRLYTVVPITQRTVTRPPLQLAPDARTAECDKATYDATTGMVVLHGTPEAQPVVHFGKDQARADLITYHRDKQLVTFEGNVQLTAQLGQKSEEPPAKGEAPKAPAPASAK